MPKLRNRVTGVVVNVSDATASRLGPDYVKVRKSRSKPEPEPKQAEKPVEE